MGASTTGRKNRHDRGPSGKSLPPDIHLSGKYRPQWRGFPEGNGHGQRVGQKRRQSKRAIKKKQAASGDWQPISGIGQNVAAEATGQALTAPATSGEGRQRHATEQQPTAGFWHGGKVAKGCDSTRFELDVVHAVVEHDPEIV